MTAKVLPFRRPAAPREEPPPDPAEYSTAVEILATRGAFVALLVARLILALALPAVAARVDDVGARRRIRRRLEVAERSVTRAVRLLVRGARP